MGSEKAVTRPAIGAFTFLFTDIEDSTGRWEHDEEKMRVDLASHDEVLQQCITRHRGVQFKHTGDGVCAAFESAVDAVDAAIAAQRELSLPVRMGLATGEAESRGGDYFGVVLNRAARVMSAAYGEQILVADSTAVFVKRDDLLDLGEQIFRGVPEPVTVYQVNAADLRSTFPALRTEAKPKGNVPLRLDEYVGRAAAQDCVLAAVRDKRVVTLIGAGGVGKTRLAIESSHDLAEEFPDGVWFVQLASIDAPESAGDAVANTLGVTGQPGASIIESLGRALANSKMLILLDNCEHVVVAAREIVNAVVGAAPEVRFLATSRERLLARGEQLLEVEPLDSAQGIGSAAVELFVMRATAVQPTFELGSHGPVVAEICEQLDGNALAIELAAARMVSLSPTEVLTRLGERLRLLTTGHGETEHHRTLRAAVKWSFDLLDEDLREFAIRCAVFADGFTASAAAQVCGPIDEYETLDLLDSLVRKSLITAERAGSGTRYRMLETIRQFALGEMVEGGDKSKASDRHAAYFANLTEQAWEEWDGPRQTEVLDDVSAEFADLRAAYRWSVSGGETERAEVLASLTTIMLFGRQQFEPIGWAENLIEDAVRANLHRLPRLFVAASVCVYAGRPVDAVEYVEQAIVLESDPQYEPLARGWSGLLAATAYRYDNKLDRSIEICRSLSEGEGLARVIGHCGLAYLLSATGDVDSARPVAERAVKLARSHGSPFWIVWALEGQGRAYSEAQPTLALQHFREALAYAREHRISYFENIAVRESAMVEALQGELDQALTQFGATLESFVEAGNVAHVVNSLADLAVLFDRVGDTDAAITLIGSTSRYVDPDSYARLPGILERVTTLRGGDAVERLVSDGAAMDLPVAVEYARAQMAIAQDSLGGVLPLS